MHYRFCDLNDYPGVIYDHECTGESNPGDPMIAKDVLFSHWIQDVHAVEMRRGAQGISPAHSGMLHNAQKWLVYDAHGALVSTFC